MKAPIPAAALESHIAIVGKTGSGKSNLGKVIAESLMSAGERVCVLDPTGTWWGLRLKPDGRHASEFKSLAIFGGEHGDIPIGEQHGAVIGEAIGTSSDSAIIDTRALTVGQRTRFFTAFAETLLRLNRGPLHLIIDEAHIFAPQGKTDPEGGKMVHAANNLVSLGRGSGLRIILISQRPQKMHKDALTQAETLVAMRLIHNLDIDAVRAWIGEQADPTRGREITSSLPSLKTGDGWVWAPQLEHLEQTRFPLASTYDSGKPLGRDQAAPLLAPLDTTALGDKMDAIRQEALANDPARLKARIRELEAAPGAIDTGAIERSRSEGWDSGYAAGVAQGNALMAASVEQQLAAMAVEYGDTADRYRESVASLKKKGALTPQSAPPATVPAARVRAAPKPSAPPAPVTQANGVSLTGPQQKIVTALSMWLALGDVAPTRQMVAFVAGYSPKSSGFANLLGAMRSAGIIDYPGERRVSLLSAPVENSTEDAAAIMASVLKAPQIKIIQALLAGGRMTRGALADKAGYSIGSSGYANLLGSLRSLTILDYPSTGTVELQSWVARVMK